MTEYLSYCLLLNTQFHSFKSTLLLIPVYPLVKDLISPWTVGDCGRIFEDLGTSQNTTNPGHPLCTSLIDEIWHTLKMKPTHLPCHLVWYKIRIETELNLTNKNQDNNLRLCHQNPKKVHWRVLLFLSGNAFWFVCSKNVGSNPYEDYWLTIWHPIWPTYTVYEKISCTVIIDNESGWIRPGR